MNFKIIKFDEYNRTMVIDWGDNVVLNHYIPTEILENDNITKERTIELIEYLRPKIPDPITIPSRLREVYEESNNTTYNENNDGEEII